jgi:hypothetical protein
MMEAADAAAPAPASAPEVEPVVAAAPTAEQQKTWQEELAGKPWRMLRNIVRCHASYIQDELDDYLGGSDVWNEITTKQDGFMVLKMGKEPKRKKLVALIKELDKEHHARLEDFVHTIDRREFKLRLIAEAMLRFIEKKSRGEVVEWDTDSDSSDSSSSDSDSEAGSCDPYNDFARYISSSSDSSSDEEEDADAKKPAVVEEMEAAEPTNEEERLEAAEPAEMEAAQ